MENRRMDSPEGTTIMSTAVFDDVLGIIVLAIVTGVGPSRASGPGGPTPS
jgi:Kef-type K+ transport system membrane component KefB